jgi:DNA-binding transcriptional ArsR family regulator
LDCRGCSSNLARCRLIHPSLPITARRTASLVTARGAATRTLVLQNPVGTWLSFTIFVVDNYHMLNLHSKIRQRLLRYYFTNPTARHHGRDLAQRLDVDPSNLSKELRHLESEGLFTSEISGRQKYFRLNRKYPLFAEVRRIVEKTIGAAPLLAESLPRIDGIQGAYLFGSFARNQQDVASDIDLIVIGNPKGATLAEAIRALERHSRKPKA